MSGAEKIFIITNNKKKGRYNFESGSHNNKANTPIRQAVDRIVKPKSRIV